MGVSVLHLTSCVVSCVPPVPPTQKSTQIEPLKFLSQSTTRCKTPSALWTSFATPCPTPIFLTFCIIASGLGASSSLSPTIDCLGNVFFHQVPVQQDKKLTQRSCCEGRNSILLAKLAGLVVSPCPCRIESSWLLRHLFLRQANPGACSKSPKAVDMCPSVVTKDRQSAMLSKL